MKQETPIEVTSAATGRGTKLKRLAPQFVFFALAAGTLVAQSPRYTVTDIESGARLYRANCVVCHGPEGDGIAGIDFHRGQFRRSYSDPELYRIVTTGIPGTAMPATQFPAGQAQSVVSYLRFLADPAARPRARGDVTRGRAIFEGKGGCPACHRVNGKGSRVAPDLSEIGAVRPASDLETSILDPNATVLSQNRFVQAVTPEGVTIRGRRLNEDTFTVQILDQNEHLVSLSKADLREYTVLNSSAMPSYQGKMSSAELDDLVSYLASLRGSTP
jgi:putative heme-binding domain-containing protein